MTRPLLDPAGIDDLRAALLAAGYTSTGVADRLGPAAVQAIQRSDFRPALRATADGDPLATLIRLFICGQSEAESVVAAALPLAARAPRGLDRRRRRRALRAAVELEPYGDWWVISDLSAALRPGRAAAGRPRARRRRRVVDPGPGDDPRRRSARRSTSARAAACRRCTCPSTRPASPRPTSRARALRFAATTAALNGLDWDLRHGDLAEPVRGRAVRPGGEQPAVRGGPGRGDAHLPRLRAPRRRGLRRTGAAPRRAC